MKDKLFEGKELYILDFSAVYQAYQLDMLTTLLDGVLAESGKVILPDTFTDYTRAVQRTMKPSKNSFSIQIFDFIEQLKKNDRLLSEDKGYTCRRIACRHATNPKACLIIGEHSPALDAIRSGEIFGMLTVCLFDEENALKCYKDVATCAEAHPAPKVHEVSRSTGYLDTETYSSVGDIVFTEDGQEIRLSKKISTGAEGIVFFTEDEHVVAKIYHRGALTPLRWRKLIQMTKHKVHGKGVCWPLELLYNFNKEPAGFTMPLAKGHTLGNVFDGMDAIRDYFCDWTRKDVAVAAKSVLEKILFLHLNGVLIGDIQLKNMMINSPSDVYVIDMDSCQIANLPCPVGTEEFTTPKIWNQSFDELLRIYDHEDYACAILSFMLLFCGQHPYNQRLSDATLQDEMAKLAFPYPEPYEPSERVPIGGYDGIWRATPASLRRMFYRCFARGDSYEAIQWYSAISAYIEALDKKNYEDAQMYALFPYDQAESSEAINQQPINFAKKSIRESIVHHADNVAVDLETRQSFGRAQRQGENNQTQELPQKPTPRENEKMPRYSERTSAARYTSKHRQQPGSNESSEKLLPYLVGLLVIVILALIVLVVLSFG